MKYLSSLLVIAIVALCSCNNNKNVKGIKNTELTTKEWEKDYQLVKILEVQSDKVSTSVDAYGFPVLIGKWYIHSGKARTLIPFSPLDNVMLTTNALSAVEKTKQLPFVGEVQVDTTLLQTQNSVGNYSISKVTILVLGGSTLHVHFDGQKIVADII